MLISGFTRYTRRWEDLLLMFGAATALLAMAVDTGIDSLPPQLFAILTASRNSLRA